MFRDILVALEENSVALTPFAVSFAKSVGARCVAVRPRRDAINDGALAARYELAAGDQEARKIKARDALEAFGSAAAAAGVEAELILPDGAQDPRRDQLAAFARGFDLTLVGQAEPGRGPTMDDLPGQLLAESGRPVLVVPAIQRDGATLSRVLAAWDGSATAARAFGDAAPLFERADSIEIVTVTNANSSGAVVQGGERLAGRLARSGLKASFKRLPSEEDAANAILSYVADVGADMLVTGGYGHSQLREALFGGATRTFLGSQTVPLFMSR